MIQEEVILRGNLDLTILLCLLSFRGTIFFLFLMSGRLLSRHMLEDTVTVSARLSTSGNRELLSPCYGKH